VGLITLFIFAAVLILSSKAIKLAYKRLEDWFDEEYIKYGFLSRYYLSSHLTQYKFEEWCIYVLESMGYKNLTNVSELIEGGVNIIAPDKNKTTYISTRLYGLESDDKKNLNDKYFKIGRPELQKFVGALVHDNITDGILITTGDFTEEAINYVKSLPAMYSVVLIDGITLTKYLRKLRKKEISTRMTGGLIN
jgi:restriction endonuclease Mrr